MLRSLAKGDPVYLWHLRDTGKHCKSKSPEIRAFYCYCSDAPSILLELPGEVYSFTNYFFL